MSTIFIEVNDQARAKIKKYTEIKFVHNEASTTIYNLFNIENTSDIPITFISIYTPYKEEEIASLTVPAGVNGHKLKKFLNNHSQIEFELLPFKICKAEQFEIEFAYTVNCPRQETEHGYHVSLSFYNTNFINGIQNGLNRSAIPPIDKDNLCLAIICSHKYTFPVADSTPRIGNLLLHEDRNDILNKAIKFIEAHNCKSDTWEEYFLWCSQQLADLPNPVEPANSGRAVKTFISKIRAIKIWRWKFTYPDMINLIIGLVSLVLTVVGIYLTK